MADINTYMKKKAEQEQSLDARLAVITAEIERLKTANAKTNANVDYVAMMTDVELDEVTDNAQ